MSIVLSENLPLLATAPDGIQKLRRLILELAVRGKLVPHDPDDEPASGLLKRLDVERKQLKMPPRPPVDDASGPFSLPEGWQWLRFGDVAQHNSGKTLDKGRNTGHSRRYITTSNLYWGRFDLANVREMLIRDEELERCTARRNDLLICEGGEAGRAAVWETDEEICFQNHVHRARFFAGVNPYYAYRIFQRLDLSGEINQFRKGVGISNLSGKALASVPLPLPPLAEQHRIVAKVDELMTLCDRLEAEQADAGAAHASLVETLLGTLTRSTDAADLAANWQRLAEHFDTLLTTESSLDALKQTILQLAVMGKLVPQDRNDEQASELLKRITKERVRLEAEGVCKKSNVTPLVSDDELPFSLAEGWEWVKVCAAFNTTSGNTFDGALEKEQGAVAYVKVGDMNLPGNELYITTSSRYIDPDSKMERWLIPTGSIVFPKRGGAIATNKKRIVAKPIFVDLNTMAITPIQGVETAYAYLWLSTIDLASLNTGTSVPQINHKDVDPLPFPLPPLAEQHRIVAKVDELMTLVERLKAGLAESRAQQERLATTLIESALKAA